MASLLINCKFASLPILSPVFPDQHAKALRTLTVATNSRLNDGQPGAIVGVHRVTVLDTTVILSSANVSIDPFNSVASAQLGTTIPTIAHPECLREAGNDAINRFQGRFRAARR